MEEHKEEKDFTIRDRRSFSAEAEEKKPQEQAQSAEQDPSDRTRPGEEQRPAGAPPDLDFSSFVLSLATTAQVSLGSIPHPETGQTTRNLSAAKRMIDILGMLAGKTRGNLSEEEQTLLDQVLFNLRMHYVRVMEEQKKSGG